MKNIIYVRVSTDDQNCDLQRDACAKWCGDRALGDIEVIEDKISGAKTSRPGFDRLMAAVRAGGVGRVICYKLDRLGRSLPHLAMIIEELRGSQTALICVSQGIDTSGNNPVGNLQMHMLMCFAQFERELIKERVNAGIKAAKSRGVKFGRPSVHRMTPTLVATRLARGQTISQIAKETGVNRGTIHRLASRAWEQAAAVNRALQDGPQ